MKKLSLQLTVLILGILIFSNCQKAHNEKIEIENKIKNVILLIPDGTSTDVVSLARQFNDNQPLAVDEIMCGFVKTTNSDGKFPDSAPTSTAYATGTKSNKKHIGIDTEQRPRISVRELSNLHGKATGVVATSEFCHATPADFVCHFSNRRDYSVLIKQFIYNSPSLVLAGGNYHLKKHKYESEAKNQGIEIITDIEAFSSLNKLPSNPVWGLFPNWYGNEYAKSFECDRNPETEPSLSEMTEKAIELLSQNEEGFFLIVEGSQVDWAAHNNDPYGVVTDFLEFDKAVGTSLNFAKSNNNTVVIVCPDHGNGGITMGNLKSGTSYYTKNKYSYSKINIAEQIISPLKQIKWSGRKMALKMQEDEKYISADSLKKYYNINATPQLISNLKKLSADKSYDAIDTMQYILGQQFSNENFIGWTTTGHTAEDVFLAVYAPEQTNRLTGVVDNSEVGQYIAEVLKLGNLDQNTEQFFAPHTSLFSQEEIKSKNKEFLQIEQNGKKVKFYANTNKYEIEGKTLKFSTIIVCIGEGKDAIYYLPKEIDGL